MKLTRPLVVLDLETTGTWIEKDKIIEIGMVRVEPDGQKTSYCKKVNPGMPIPAVVAELTGITDADVKDAPAFKDIVLEVMDFIGDADLGGFNLGRFDLPLLSREISEAGHVFDWSRRTVFDAQKVFHYHEKRDLTAAYRFYCGKDLEGAHSALADTEATLAILEAQVQKYAPDNGSVESLSAYDAYSSDEFYDEGRRFRWWNGELYMMFGKYGRKMSLREVARQDPGYLKWILTKDFSEDVKYLVENALSGKFPEKEQQEK